MQRSYWLINHWLWHQSDNKHQESPWPFNLNSPIWIPRSLDLLWLHSGPNRSFCFPSTALGFRIRKNCFQAQHSEKRPQPLLYCLFLTTLIIFFFFSCCQGTKRKATLLRIWQLQFTFNLLLTCFPTLKPFGSSCPLPTMCSFHWKKKASSVSRVNTSRQSPLGSLRAICQEEPHSLIDTLKFFIFSASVNDLKLLLFVYDFWISKNRELKLVSIQGY